MPTRLIVDDDRAMRASLVRALSDAGFVARPASGVRTARAILAAGGIDGVLLDVRLKDGDGIALLGEIRAQRPSLPVIMVTAFGDSERTIEAMRIGAFDYLTKPFDFDQLLGTVTRAVSAPPVAAPLPEATTGEEALIGSSGTMLAVWKAIGRAASSSAAVLVTGESGTGKELVARAIHQHSDRRAQPFVAVNVAALPATLVESELFGHEKGAFTGASSSRAGRFEAAGGGTLFLDEIGDLDVAIQTKLLRVLQEGTFERVGGQEPRRTVARIVAATSRPVRPGAVGSTLREDLFYRLAVLDIELPALRERRSDIPALVHAVLRRRPGPRRAVSEEAMLRLCAHAWKGNVRELFHAIESACVRSTSDILDVGDFKLSSPAPEVGPLGDLSIPGAIAALEKRLIVEALDRTGGNVSEAARLVRLSRPAVYAKMLQYGIRER